MSARNLVLFQKFDLQKNGVLRFPDVPGKPELDELKRTLMYWDKIHIPKSPVYSTPLQSEAKFLVDEGALIWDGEWTDYKGSITKFESFPWASVSLDLNWEQSWESNKIQAFLEHEKREPGQWAMGRSGPDWGPSAPERPNTRVLVIELYNALPVPDESIPLEEIFEFRQQRKDELNALRAHIDGLYQEILTSEDLPHAASTVITDVQKSVAAVNKLSDEKWHQRLKQSLRQELNFDAMWKGATAGYFWAFAHQQSAMGMVLCGLAGAAGAIKLSVIKETFWPQLPAHLKPYAYFYKPEHP